MWRVGLQTRRSSPSGRKVSGFSTTLAFSDSSASIGTPKVAATLDT
jgi:hypothetical protein